MRCFYRPVFVVGLILIGCPFVRSIVAASEPKPTVGDTLSNTAKILNSTLPEQIRSLAKRSETDAPLRQQMQGILQEAQKALQRPLMYRAFSIVEMKSWTPAMEKRSGGIDPRTAGF